MAYINKLAADLKKQAPFAEKIRIKIDRRDKASVDKFWEWTRKGAPVICEIGMRDVDGGKVMVKERTKLGTAEGKQIVSFDEFVSTITSRLENMQKEIFSKAKNRLEQNIRTDISSPEDFKNTSQNQIFGLKTVNQGKSLLYAVSGVAIRNPKRF